MYFSVKQRFAYKRSWKGKFGRCWKPYQYNKKIRLAHSFHLVSKTSKNKKNFSKTKKYGQGTLRSIPARGKIKVKEKERTKSSKIT
jgi:hypothetical protein